MSENFVAFSDAYQKFSIDLLQGQAMKIDYPKAIVKLEPENAPAEITHKRVTVRFAKPIPAIIGADMKIYGPFAAEDVASVPAENAKILVKQGLAEVVEVP